MPFDASGVPAVIALSSLTYVNDNEPGIYRRRSGKGFSYRWPDGRTVKDKATLWRIRRLAIPPAWTEVWICADRYGHIQATGRDAKGRKQYRYHPEWTELQSETKFARMAAFGRALRLIRQHVDDDLALKGLPRERVLAAVVRLLELTLIRVGNDEYAKTNKSFGLTTMRNRHVKVDGSDIVFQFTGKSGIKHKAGLRNRSLARILRSLQEAPGQRLFQYIDETGESRPISSTDVNAYLKEITGEQFTAKDFRTWAGTVAAAKALALQPRSESAAEAKRLVKACVTATAHLLGNTPTVCRAAYIHPAVLEAFTENRLPKAFADKEGAEYEAAVLKFLDRVSEEVSRETGMTLRQQLEASAR